MSDRTEFQDSIPATRLIIDALSEGDILGDHGACIEALARVAGAIAIASGVPEHAKRHLDSVVQGIIDSEVLQ